jgi:predicted DNA-binding protein with PD1-like motif
METPTIRYLTPAEAAPTGEAPGVRIRLLATQSNGVKFWVLVLSHGDEVATALAQFAREQGVVSAHLSAIGAVRDPEVGWFDLDRQQYKAMRLEEQMEVLTLSGDIALGEDGQPVVHAHMALGGSDGQAWGGHLLHAIASPTLEVYVTTYPDALHKRQDPHSGLQLIDPSIS